MYARRLIDLGCADTNDFDYLSNDTPMDKLADDLIEALEEELQGFEFAAGIPGTIGGAVVMNAGAYGGEMKDVVIETEYIDKDLNIKKLCEKGLTNRPSCIIVLST